MTKTNISLLLACALSSGLHASSVQLDKITVTTPTKSTQALHKITANTTVITSEKIQERGYKSLSDVLKTVSGFTYNRSGGLGQTTSMMLRGHDGKRILVLIDGIRANDPASLSGADFSHLLLDNVEKIEIVKGAQSGIWGADATAGVINIITKKAGKEGLSASIFGEYGSYETFKYGLNSSYKQDKFDLTLNASRLTTDGFSAVAPANSNLDDLEDDAYENNTLDLKAGYSITERDRVEAFYSLIDADTEYDGYDASFQLDPNDTTASVESKEQFYGLSYTRSEGKNKTKLYANRSKFERYYPNGFTKNFDGSVDEIGLNTSLAYAKDGALSAGIDHKKFKHNNDISKDYTNQGIFISNYNSFNALIAGETIFSQAVRYDKFDAFNNKMTCKIGLKHIHENIKDFWTSFNYGGGYNVPTLYQLYSFYGNEALRAEKSNGFDVTLNYKGIAVTYFQNTIDDMIDYDFATNKYANIKGESTLKGVEFSYANSVESLNLAYNFNYTYLNAKDKDGKKLLRRPENSANVSFDYYGFANTHLGTQIRYIGERDDVGGIKMDSYTVVDLITEYEVNTQLNLYLKIDNLLDEAYQEINGYATPERSFYAGFRYKVK